MNDSKLDVEQSVDLILMPYVELTLITISSPTFRGGKQDDQGFASGDGMPDVIGSAASLSEEFKLWLSRHHGLSIDEALHRYRDEQKAKQRRKGIKL